MKFLLDAGLPPRLAKALVRRGHVAWHVTDCRMLNAKDRELWRFALAEGAAIITRNGDFAALHSHAPGGPPVVWLRRADLGSHALEKVLLSALRQIVAGEGVVEVQ
jgi:predicted nuclease of predicted toxin-antitoxin system